MACCAPAVVLLHCFFNAAQHLGNPMQGLLVSPRMTEDHYTTTLLRSLKAVSERLAQQEGKSGKEHTQGSSQVAAADKKSSDKGQEPTQKLGRESGGLKEAVLGGVFDLV